MALSLLLGACSSPDWVNPGSWFEDDPPQAETIIIPDDNSAIPNLATVPTLPPVPSPQVQRQQIAEGLAADRENARYSDEPLTSATTAVPAADPPLGNAPAPAPFDVATVPAEGGISSAPLAPPPPGTAAAGSPSGAPAAAPSSAPAAAQPVGQPVGQPGLLQQQAYQQLFQQRQRTQQLALQNQAFEQEARQRAIEQQFLRQQAIEQQAVQRRALELQARQLAVVPVPQAPALQVAPQAFPTQGYAQGYAPQAAFAGGAAAAGYGAGAAGYGAAVGQGQPPPSGNLIGVIYFQHGSTSLDGNDQEVLRQVAGMAQQSGAGLQVVGHASARTGALDPVRHRMANLQVSMARANRVAEALARLGSPRERIIVSAQSDGRPVYHEFMPTGEAGNRRVEIYLQY